MPSTTASAALPYPVGGDAPDVPLYVGNLATALDQKVIVRAANSSARASLTKYDGMLVYETSTQRFFRWNASSTRWEFVAGPWYTWTPTLVDSANSPVTGTITARGIYTIQEGLLKYKASMVFNGSIDGRTGELVLTMPTGTTRRGTEPFPYGMGTALLSTPATSDWWLGATYPNAAAKVGILFPNAANISALNVFRNATGVGATGTGRPLISGSYPLTPGARLSVWGEYELDSWAAL